jgi:uncharacterized protein YndB with AHSA1/START domain
MRITVSTRIKAPASVVWRAYTTPSDIMKWNAASDDWHTVSASVDLKNGGRFCSRMEAKDGSFGFDFEGVYTEVVVNSLIKYEFGGRNAQVKFSESAGATEVQVDFDSEETHAIEQQQQGWQAILENFKKHVEALAQSSDS